MSEPFSDLTSRLAAFEESRNPSAVLDPAALEEAGLLWEKSFAGNGTDADPGAVLVAVAFLHLFRCQSLPGKLGLYDAGIALAIFGALPGRERRRLPRVIRRSLAPVGPDSADVDGQLSAEGFTAFEDSQRTGQREALDAAVAAFRYAVAATPARHPDLAARLTELSAALGSRFARDGLSADLDAAVELGQQAVVATPDGDPDRGARLGNLGASLGLRFAYRGDLADLDAAIELGERAVATIPPGDPAFAQQTGNLSMAVRTRFRQQGSIADLDRAIELIQWAAAATASDDPAFAVHLANLSNAHLTRYTAAGTRDDLEDAVSAAEQAVAAAAPGPLLAASLSALGGALLARFGLTGNRADLDAAIDAGQHAVTLAAGAPNRPLYLSNLGNALRARYQLTKDRAELDAAIAAGQQAVSASSLGRPDAAVLLTNLGAALGDRHSDDPERRDLDTSIASYQQALAATPPGDPDRPSRHLNLGSGLLRRFRAEGDRADLDAAARHLRQAYEALPAGHPASARYLSNLLVALVKQCEDGGASADLDIAISAARRIVARTMAADLDLARLLISIGNALLARWERGSETGDLDAAIDAAWQAIALTPPDHPSLAGCLLSLAISLSARYGRTGASGDLDGVISAARQACTVTAAAPAIRLAAAHTAGATAAGAQRTRDAAGAYATAVGLLPQVAWRGLSRAAREEQLAQWAGLTAEAATCAIANGQPGLAVELLEQGRSILWTQALQLRSDLARLTEKAPHLARRLSQARTMLDEPEPDAALPATLPPAHHELSPGQDRDWQKAELRRRSTQEWELALAEVRKLSGFESFLATTPYAQLATVAVAGPVVIINTSDYGSHALVVRLGGTTAEVITLDQLTWDAALTNAKLMLEVLGRAGMPGLSRQEREDDRDAVLDVLGWLWDAIAGPVLTALGYHGPPPSHQPWPRVWWCPTGPLTALPLHAAGQHRRDPAGIAGTDSVLDRVISSYTPTLTALTQARQSARPTPVRQLTVGMPTTPGLLPLPGVANELNILARHFPPGHSHCQLAGTRATRGAVQAAIAESSWLHMACHARQQHTDPSGSGFALWDGTLTIADFTQLPTQHKDLAFLSACETAAGSIPHLDEAIHLAAGMQFLGYQHVIATLWAVADNHAPYVADSVYTALTADGRADPSHAAHALHQAVHTLRHSRPGQPLLWAPYIHIGL